MKVKTVRASGLPVDEEQYNAYKAEWTDIVDKARDKCGFDMLRMQKLLARIENILNKRYTLIDEWEYEVSETEWVRRIEKYGNIMSAITKEDKSLVYIIMDDQEVM